MQPATSFSNRPTNPAEINQIIRDYEQQCVAIEAYQAKTAFAMQQVTELYQYDTFSQDQLFMYLEALDETAEYASDIEQARAAARRRRLESYIDHMHKLRELGARNIAKQTALEFDESPPIIIEQIKQAPEPVKRGLMSRLLGT